MARIRRVSSLTAYLEEEEKKVKEEEVEWSPGRLDTL
jgi:hypothetical protein